MDLLIYKHFSIKNITLEQFESNPKNKLENKKYKYME